MYIFIIGHGKCGTTALANWIESNGWAQYLTKGLKESNIITTGDLTLPLKSAAFMSLIFS
jgi:hypothetical protein